MTEKEGAANLPKPEKGRYNGGRSSWGTIKNGVTLRIPKLVWSNNWVTTSMPPRDKGSFEKWDRIPIGRTLRADHGGKAYRDSDWDLKTNERYVAKICRY